MSESCHNYGSIPAYFLSSYLLGVRVEHPLAEKRLVLNPRPADLGEARGVVVTPFGPVPMAWTIRDGVWDLEFNVPHGVTAELRLPDTDPASLDARGTKVPAPRTEGRVTVLEIGPGAYHIRAKRR
jgi:hypothetical protein